MSLADVRIEYSDRKTLGLIVDRDASVLVRAPHGASVMAIEEFLERKRYWLWEKTNHARKYPAGEVLKEFVTGESFLFLGRMYRLEVVEEQAESLQFNKQFTLRRAELASARSVFLSWYVNQAREFLIPRAEAFACRMGVEFEDIKVSDLRYRWGSCSPKNKLNFNWRLIKAPSNVIDYIIVHELAHLIEPNHSPEFWNVVSIHSPNYLKAKEWLAEHGSELEAKP